MVMNTRSMARIPSSAENRPGGQGRQFRAHGNLARASGWVWKPLRPGPFNRSRLPSESLWQTLPGGQPLARVFIADLEELFVGIEADHLKSLYRRCEK